MWAVLAVLTLCLVGCAASPQPAWRHDVRYAVEQATQATLTGRLRVAEQQWQAATQAAAASARADVLARVALTRCAVEQAALQWRGCAAARPYLADASAAERAYAAYLALDARAGTGDSLDIGALPSPHRALAQALLAGASSQAVLAALAAIEDPLARLVAGGVAWRAGRLDASGVALLVETASQQGWRGPLSVWLGVQARLAEVAGDTETAARARRRQAWALGGAAAEQLTPAGP